MRAARKGSTWTGAVAAALVLTLGVAAPARAQSDTCPEASGDDGWCAAAILLARATGPASSAADASAIADQTASNGDAAPEESKPTHGFFDALGHNLLDDLRHIPRRNSIYWLAGGGGLAFAVHPADHELNRRLLGSKFADVAFAPGKYAGATEVQIGAAMVTYVVGRARHQPRAEHIGMDMLEAQILSEGIVEATKFAVRRPRPVNPDGSHAAGYSFPSGHATVTFATATVFQQHFGWEAAVPTYALATYVATSRLHDNVHFLSDVVFGAATGIIIGRSVTWHGRNTFTVMAVPVQGGAGAAIVW